jgi:hypothetical protein
VTSLGRYFSGSVYVNNNTSKLITTYIIS